MPRDYSSKWHQADGAIAAVLTDDERNAIVVAARQELPGPLPTDELVTVVNQAWTTCIDQNAPTT